MKKIRIISVVSIVVLLMFALVSCDSSDYKKAVELYDSGEYETALAMFEQLQDYEDSLSFAELAKVEIAKKHFESGEFDAAEKIFKEVDKKTENEELKEVIAKHLSGIDKLRKYEGEWEASYITNGKRDRSYIGTQWTFANVSLVVKPPYKIRNGSSDFSDVEWGVDATVELTSTVYMLTGGTGGTTSSKTFTYNKLASFDHSKSQKGVELSDDMWIVNEKGYCMFSPKTTASNSYICFEVKSDNKTMTLSEYPYNYNWSVSYSDEAVFVDLTKQNS